MSIQVMSEVWAFAAQKGTKLLLLLAIADFANDEGQTFPSLATLSTKIRMSERNTQYLLRALEVEGALKTEVRPYRSNLYTVLRPWGANIAPLHKKARKKEPGGGAKDCAITVLKQNKKEKKEVSLSLQNEKDREHQRKGSGFLTKGSKVWNYANPNPGGSDEGKSTSRS